MKYFLYLPVLILSLYLSSCSELETNIEQAESVSIHKEGILNPSSHDFHGNLIRDNNWDTNQCQQCHGSDYAGGLVDVSCLTCHNQNAGPENCSTCHGSETSPAPPEDIDGNTSTSSPRVGAHQIHLRGGLLGKRLSCSDCHKVPSSLHTEGHVDTELPAEVIINGFLANIVTNDPSTMSYNPGLPLFVPDPAYNPDNHTCSNTYCHGYFKNGNLDNSPVWTDPNTAACGTCHGDPSAPTLFEKALPRGEHINVPPPPVGEPCSNCHGGIIDENMKIIDPLRHIDGKLNLFGDDIKF